MVAITVTAGTPAAAQGSYSPYNETPAAALARYVHTLANSPKDFTALIGAGRSALELGDTQSAAGFFARADEVDPRSPDPQAGMGAVSVATGDPKAAMPYFKRAQQLGASAAGFACDRGLAYDLLGQQAQAQADYRLAQSGPDADEATRRLALSLAIGGNRAEALQTLSPLLAKGDAGAARARAFVLALTGDTTGASTVIDAAMPGSWSRVSPFLQRLPSLRAGQKAAAVNLGIFPDSDSPYMASTPATVTTAFSGTTTTERVAGIDDLLRGNASPTPVAAPPAATQVAYSAPVAQPQPVPERPHRIWLQLASASNAAPFPGQFGRLKQHNPDLFEGITGYVAVGGDRARLVIGPFQNSDDAHTFAEGLDAVHVIASEWSNSTTDRIVPLGTE